MLLWVRGPAVEVVVRERRHGGRLAGAVAHVRGGPLLQAGISILDFSVFTPLWMKLEFIKIYGVLKVARYVNGCRICGSL